MKTAFGALAILILILGGILFLAARADNASAPQPVQQQLAEIPQTGVSGPGGSQGNPPGTSPLQPAALIGLAASLAGVIVLGFSVLVLSRHKRFE